MSSSSNWDFFNRNVQSGLLEGRYLSAAFTLIAAGPPRLEAISSGEGELGDIAWPIGVLQSFNIGQNAQVMRVWEIGSERSYFMNGRVAGQIGLGRIVYYGPSLLRALYAYMKSETGPVQFQQLYQNSAQMLLNTSGRPGGKVEYDISPGHENIWLNLASDVFSQPIGLLVYMRDSNKDTVGAFYVEDCHVANHGLALDAGGTILTENASLLYERLVPVNVQAVQLIKDSTDIQSIVGSTVVGSAA